MANVQIRLDSRGLAELLKSDMIRQAIAGPAQQIAESARASTGADVVVDAYTTDRAAFGVTIRHRDAMMWQARDGVLTRAAASAGLEVKARAR